MYSRLLLLKTISLFIFILLLCSSQYKNPPKKDYDSIMMDACKQYIINYTPLYVIDGDTTIVARFNTVPDSINSYLIDCAKHNNLKPLKYSAALIIRQHQEYLEQNNQEYMLMDALIQENGFIILLRQAMGIGNVDDEFTSMDYFPLFSGEVCGWINDNKKIIDDYKFIKKQMRRHKSFRSTKAVK